MIPLSRKRWTAILGAVVLIGVVIAWYIGPATPAHAGDVIVDVQSGEGDLVAQLDRSAIAAKRSEGAAAKWAISRRS